MKNKFGGIRGKLYFLIIFSLIIATVISIFSNSLHQITIQKYKNSLDSQIALNNFFTSNQRIHDLFREYVLYPTSINRESYEAEINYAALQLDALSQISFSSDFTKKIGDLQNMFSTFQEKAGHLTDSFHTLTPSELAYELEDVLFVNDLIDYTYSKYTSFHAKSVSTETLQLISLMERNNRVYCMIMVIGCILICIIGYFVINQIIQPVLQISENAVALSQQKFDIPDICLKTHDELSLLADAFNSMKSSINSYIQKLNEHSLLQETYLKALQTQINSHFLFNTLNLISRTAYFEGAPQTIQLLDATTDILRYSLYQTQESVSIFKEISFAETYIHIQRMRFSDRLSFHTVIDDDLKDISVPPFILQPLIENAIVHGAYNKPDLCTIFTAVLQFEDRILILVEDDGCGADENTLRNIFEKAPSSTGGIGLGNLNKRLQLFYQKENMIRIYSQKNEFFRVEIEIRKEQYL